MASGDRSGRISVQLCFASCSCAKSHTSFPLPILAHHERGKREVKHQEALSTIARPTPNLLQWFIALTSWWEQLEDTFYVKPEYTEYRLLFSSNLMSSQLFPWGQHMTCNLFFSLLSSFIYRLVTGSTHRTTVVTSTTHHSALQSSRSKINRRTWRQPTMSGKERSPRHRPWSVYRANTFDLSAEMMGLALSGN